MALSSGVSVSVRRGSGGRLLAGGRGRTGGCLAVFCRPILCRCAILLPTTGVRAVLCLSLCLAVRGVA